jgi:iron complex outermembrane receptor protein
MRGWIVRVPGDSPRPGTIRHVEILRDRFTICGQGTLESPNRGDHAQQQEESLRSPSPVLALAVAAACSAGPAWSQDGASARSDKEEGAAQLDVVTVTAQRRVENVNEVPISITTIADEKLDVIGSGGDDIRVLSGRLPSLNIESSFGRAFPRF